jgi:hypothetical protein
VGRPSKRTPENEDAIIEALTKGYTRKASAAFGGVSYTTMREWELAFPEFAEALQKAEGIAQNALIDTIVHASTHGTVTTRPDGTVIESPGAWQAAAWVLERRWPKDYSRREAVEMSGPDGGPIDTRDLSKVPDHEREALAAAIRDHLASRRRPPVRAGGEPDPQPGD